MPDVIVIGGGVAGLSLAQVLGRARRDVLVLTGGSPRNVSAAEMHAMAGHDGIAPAEFLRTARKEVERYPSVSMVGDDAVSASGAVNDFTVETAGGDTVSARRIVLATGVADDLPSIDGLADQWGRTVLHCPYCHGWEVRDEPLAVLALSPVDTFVSAHLTQWSSDVVFCSNGVEIGEDQLAVLSAAGVRHRSGTVTAVSEDPGGLRLTFADGGTMTRRALFVHAPTRQRSGLAGDLGCELLEEDDAVAVDELGQTNVAGVYAVGDMARRRTQEADLTFAARAMGNGVVTAVAVNRELFFTSLFT